MIRKLSLYLLMGVLAFSSTAGAESTATGPFFKEGDTTTERNTLKIRARFERLGQRLQAGMDAGLISQKEASKIGRLLVSTRREMDESRRDGFVMDNVGVARFDSKLDRVSKKLKRAEAPKDDSIGEKELNQHLARVRSGGKKDQQKSTGLEVQDAPATRRPASLAGLN